MIELVEPNWMARKSDWQYALRDIAKLRCACTHCG
jgi:hypothetical protein